jgi:hypothetical protein
MPHGSNRPSEQSGVPVVVTHYSRRVAISVLLLLQAGVAFVAEAAANGSEVEFTAVQGLRVVTLGLIGAGAAAVPHERLRALMQSALTH